MNHPLCITGKLYQLYLFQSPVAERENIAVFRCTNFEVTLLLYSGVETGSLRFAGIRWLPWKCYTGDPGTTRGLRVPTPRQLKIHNPL